MLVLLVFVAVPVTPGAASEEEAAAAAAAVAAAADRANGTLGYSACRATSTAAARAR
jgi:hypothetical protein